MNPVASLNVEVRILFTVLACAGLLPAAHGAERGEVATALYELRQSANAVAALDGDFRSLIEASSGEERLDLYWTYNHLTGSWSHVEDLRAQLELSLAADSYRDQDSVRATLADQAQFVRWELGYAIADLEKRAPVTAPRKHLWIKESLRWMLTVTRARVDSFWMAQCAYIACVADPGH